MGMIYQSKKKKLKVNQGYFMDISYKHIYPCKYRTMLHGVNDVLLGCAWFSWYSSTVFGDHEGLSKVKRNFADTTLSPININNKEFVQSVSYLAGQQLWSNMKPLAYWNQNV